jgi:hypothetical protein
VQNVEVIGTWASVAGESESVGVHRVVLGHLNALLAVLTTSPDQSQPKEKEGKMKTELQMLDSLLVLEPYLPAGKKAKVVGIAIHGRVLNASKSTCDTGGEIFVASCDMFDYSVFRALSSYEYVLELEDRLTPALTQFCQSSNRYAICRQVATYVRIMPTPSHWLT